MKFENAKAGDRERARKNTKRVYLQCKKEATDKTHHNIQNRRYKHEECSNISLSLSALPCSCIDISRYEKLPLIQTTFKRYLSVESVCYDRIALPKENTENSMYTSITQYISALFDEMRCLEHIRVHAAIKRH